MMATTKLERLAAVPLFAGLSKSQLQQVVHLTDEVRVPKGAVITRQGRLGSEFFIIKEGTVSVRHDGAQVAVLRAGDHFGELSLLGAPLRIADCVAEVDAELIVIGAREFTSLLRDVPDIAVPMLRVLAQRLQAAP